MITDFRLFGFEHIISIVIPVIIGILFIYFAKKYPNKQTAISLALAGTIFAIRSVRYIFDIQVGDFNPLDLLSIHICNIDLYLLIICLIWPNRKIFTFNFLVGIPTALAVALLPGQTHPDPGMARAIFFIMSHTMLVMGAIYLLAVYRFSITKKDLLFYYAFSLIGMAVIYIFNLVTGLNFMYLMQGPKGTVLGIMYSNFGPVLYLLSIYLILVSLISLLYGVYKLSTKKHSRKTDQSTANQ